MRFVRLMAFACAFASLATADTIVVESFATVKFGDGSVVPIPLTFRELPGANGVLGFSGQLTPNGGDIEESISVEGSFKSDPFLSASVTIIDSGAPTAFLVTFGAPVLGGPYGKLTTNFWGVPPSNRSLSVDGATLEAGVGATYPTLTFDPGLTLTIANCNQEDGCGPAGPASVFGSYSPGFMALEMAFTGPGDQGSVSFTGRLDVEGTAPVPEPGAMGLAAIGLASVAWLRRRRQQAKPQLL